MKEYENKMQELKKEELHKVESDIKEITDKESNKEWWQFWK
jgi:hypothetical protein